MNVPLVNGVGHELDASEYEPGSDGGVPAVSVAEPFNCPVHEGCVGIPPARIAME